MAILAINLAFAGRSVLIEYGVLEPDNELPTVFKAQISDDRIETLYRNGTQLYDEGKREEAFVLLLQAAENGHAKAQFNVAEMYQYGWGVSRDRCLATEWFDHSARGGFPPAQYEMGLIYLANRSVISDSITRLLWILEAARNRYPPAVEALENGDAYDDAFLSAKDAFTARKTHETWRAEEHTPAQIIDIPFIPYITRPASLYGFVGTC
ncbi:tetratricopeptide repeat protein [Magnetospira sp. QH-2]|uniref:tetratricopeptide repeat protein n=1 Tax=Magnetospira sp. (strain QH-2) TaxID=1288970 RepID=UPI000697DFE7|nr:tetratricopeptide repeat protein [Magnetospira sp. QH-2]